MLVYKYQPFTIDMLNRMFSSKSDRWILKPQSPAWKAWLEGLRERTMADTETIEQRPHCEKVVIDQATGTCGSERGLRRIKYDGPQRDSIYCPEHFGKEWAHPDASEAEPVHTDKADK